MITFLEASDVQPGSRVARDARLLSRCVWVDKRTVKIHILHFPQLLKIVLKSLNTSKYLRNHESQFSPVLKLAWFEMAVLSQTQEPHWLHALPPRVWHLLQWQLGVELRGGYLLTLSPPPPIFFLIGGLPTLKCTWAPIKTQIVFSLLDAALYHHTAELHRSINVRPRNKHLLRIDAPLFPKGKKHICVRTVIALCQFQSKLLFL